MNDLLKQCVTRRRSSGQSINASIVQVRANSFQGNVWTSRYRPGLRELLTDIRTGEPSKPALELTNPISVGFTILAYAAPQGLS